MVKSKRDVKVMVNIAASHTTQKTLFLPTVLWLVYCGDATFKYIAAAVHKPQYTREKNSLLCTAAHVLWP